MAKLYDISQSFTTPYHPQGNAYAERLHKFFRQAIASYCINNHRIWDEYLRILMSCYNDSYHEALGVSPNQVLFGTTSGLGLLTDVVKPQGDFTEMGYIEKQQYILAKTYSLVFNKIVNKQLRNALRIL